MTEILKLPLELRRDGAKYKLVKRGLKTLMYARIAFGMIVSYEVFKIKIRKAGNINGHPFSAREKFPHHEAFGDWAKCLKTLKRAEEVFFEYEK